MEYKVVTAIGVGEGVNALLNLKDALERQVTSLIERGYKPIGNPSLVYDAHEDNPYDSYSTIQVMVKE